MLQRLLDKTIFWSFDASGYRRHAARFRSQDVQKDLRGCVVLVTGANSGIGYATAEGLARLGAEVHLLCRNPQRGEAALARLRQATGSETLHLHRVDMGDLADIQRFAQHDAPPRIHRLIHNAGALVSSRQPTPQGLELTDAVHVVGPHLLTRLLLPRMQGGRVITVASGGMYGARVQTDDPGWGQRPFNGVQAYAEAKRAQVTLNVQWCQRPEAGHTVLTAMHPGWAATPGVETGLPRFHRWMKNRLRTPAEGADTVIWLAVRDDTDALCTGSFWFDRAEAPLHLRSGTHADTATETALWDRVEATVAPYLQETPAP